MSKYKIVAITNCPAGIAHTYMVAEAFEKKARELGHEIQVETQGASGIENELSATSIEQADYVILAIGRSITESDRNRFVGKKVIQIKVSDALKEVNTIFDDLESKATLMQGSKNTDSSTPSNVEAGSIISHLMSGISAALPFVIGGGILLALGSILGQWDIQNPEFEKLVGALVSLGELGFKFMIPIIGAYISLSIADKPGFAPAFIITYFANDAGLMGIESGAGFLGAIFFGLTIGYFVKWLKSFNYHHSIRSLMNLTVIPAVTILIFGLFAFYIMGPFLGNMIDLILNMLKSAPPEFRFPLAFLIGAMLAFDMGGPVNKIAWLFCFSLLSEKVYDWYAIVGVVASIPPVAVGIATFLRPKMFTEEEHGMAISAIVVGATVATEPAIPYALAAPIPMISANTIAGGVAGVLTVLFGVQRIAPGIGVFDPLLGLMYPGWAFYLAYALGVALNIVLIIVFKGIYLKRREEKARA